MGFIRDCFTGGDSYAQRQPPPKEGAESDLYAIATVFGIMGIAGGCALIHPIVGGLVLIAGLALGAWMDTEA